MKKRFYWTRGVHVDGNKKELSAKNIGDMVCISDEWDETDFNIYILKYSNYNIMMMSTFSDLTMQEGQKEERRMINGKLLKLRHPTSLMIIIDTGMQWKITMH